VFAVVSIRDRGKGIDPDIFPRLFTKFTTKSSQGTGLGLYLAKSIIEAHGGHIWAQNNYENEEENGSTFSFSLPLDTY
jgi:signal transduction histidine kinase